MHFWWFRYFISMWSGYLASQFTWLDGRRHPSFKEGNSPIGVEELKSVIAK